MSPQGGVGTYQGRYKLCPAFKKKFKKALWLSVPGGWGSCRRAVQTWKAGIKGTAGGPPPGLQVSFPHPHSFTGRQSRLRLSFSHREVVGLRLSALGQHPLLLSALPSELDDSRCTWGRGEDAKKGGPLKYVCEPLL